MERKHGIVGGYLNQFLVGMEEVRKERQNEEVNHFTSGGKAAFVYIVFSSALTFFF
jgi:hypothetical protein